MTNEEELINPEAFKSIQILTRLKNTTTRTEVTPSEKNKIQFLEFTENGVVLDVPAKSCAQGHNVLVDLAVENSNPPLKFQFSAKVEKIESAGDTRASIHLTLLQYDSKTWKVFHGLFSNRQNEIEKFFEAVKGF